MRGAARERKPKPETKRGTTRNPTNHWQLPGISIPGHVDRDTSPGRTARGDPPTVTHGRRRRPRVGASRGVQTGGAPVRATAAVVSMAPAAAVGTSPAGITPRGRLYRVRLCRARPSTGGFGNAVPVHKCCTARRLLWQTHLGYTLDDGGGRIKVATWSPRRHRDQTNLWAGTFSTPSSPRDPSHACTLGRTERPPGEDTCEPPPLQRPGPRH